MRRILPLGKAILIKSITGKQPVTIRGRSNMVIAFFRTIILYALIIAGIRIMGKRQVGELEPSELVLALLISDLAAVPMQDFGIPLLAGVIPIVTLLCITMILSVITMKSIRFRALMCGRPSVIIQDGKLRQGNMEHNRMTIDELMEELRLQGITDISTVKYAILETNGRVSVLPYADELPVTAKQMGIPAEDVALPLVIINDGRLISHNLKARGLNDVWLNKQLEQAGFRHISDVFLMTVDEHNNTFLAPQEGKT